MAHSNKAYKKAYRDLIRLSTDIKRKMLIFVVLRYYEILGREPTEPSRLALFSKKELEQICHSLEVEIVKIA
jgi:hypothetical protein